MWPTIQRWNSTPDPRKENSVKLPRIGFVLAAVVLALSAAAEDLAPSISATDLHGQLQQGSGPLVLDVRTREEYTAGHVPGAVNIPHTELAGRLGEIESDRGVVLYCMVGPRARLGEEILRRAGVAKVFHLEGGLAAWRDADLPVETGGTL